MNLITEVGIGKRSFLRLSHSHPTRGHKFGLYCDSFGGWVVGGGEVLPPQQIEVTGRTCPTENETNYQRPPPQYNTSGLSPSLLGCHSKCSDCSQAAGKRGCARVASLRIG